MIVLTVLMGFINLTLIAGMLMLGRMSPSIELIFVGEDRRFYLYDVWKQFPHPVSEALDHILINQESADWLPHQQQVKFLGLNVVGEIYTLDVRRKTLDHYQVENFNHRAVV